MKWPPKMWTLIEECRIAWKTYQKAARLWSIHKEWWLFFSWCSLAWALTYLKGKYYDKAKLWSTISVDFDLYPRNFNDVISSKCSIYLYLPQLMAPHLRQIQELFVDRQTKRMNKNLKDEYLPLQVNTTLGSGFHFCLHIHLNKSNGMLFLF